MSNNKVYPSLALIIVCLSISIITQSCGWSSEDREAKTEQVANNVKEYIIKNENELDFWIEAEKRQLRIAEENCQYFRNNNSIYWTIFCQLATTYKTRIGELSMRKQIGKYPIKYSPLQL